MHAHIESREFIREIQRAFGKKEEVTKNWKNSKFNQFFFFFHSDTQIWFS